MKTIKAEDLMPGDVVEEHGRITRVWRWTVTEVQIFNDKVVINDERRYARDREFVLVARLTSPALDNSQIEAMKKNTKTLNDIGTILGTKVGGDHTETVTRAYRYAVLLKRIESIANDAFTGDGTRLAQIRREIALSRMLEGN